MGSAKHRKNASSNASAASSKAGSRREKPATKRISAVSNTTDESWLPEEESDVSGIADDSALSEVLNVEDVAGEDVDQLATGLKRSLRLKSGNRPISLAEPDTEEEEEEENENEEEEEGEREAEEMDGEEEVEEAEGSDDAANEVEMPIRASRAQPKCDIDAASAETLAPESDLTDREMPEVLSSEEHLETDGMSLCESADNAQSTCNMRLSEGDNVKGTCEVATEHAGLATDSQTDEESEEDEDEIELNSADEEIEDIVGGESEVDEESLYDAQGASDIEEAEDSFVGVTAMGTPCSGMEALLLACGQVRLL
jgi:hypothetical protein